METIVSIIIPCFNHGRFLGDAIQSVLQTTHFGVEVIVVDDGSSDNTRQVARSFGPAVHYIRQDNRGLSASRNTGIRMARGSFLSFLDADDCFYPRKIERQLKTFCEKPSLGLVYCGWNLVRDGDFALLRTKIPMENYDFADELLTRSLFHVLCPLVRREAVDRTGLFDENLTSCEDRDYWLRAATNGVQFGCVPEVLAWVRVREDSMNTNIECMYRNRLAVFEKHSSVQTDMRALLAKRARIHLQACSQYLGKGDEKSALASLKRALSDKPDVLEKSSVWESALVGIAGDPYRGTVDLIAAESACRVLLNLCAHFVPAWKRRRLAFFGQMSLGRLARDCGNDLACRTAYSKAVRLAMNARILNSRLREAIGGIILGAGSPVAELVERKVDVQICPPPGKYSFRPSPPKMAAC